MMVLLCKAQNTMLIQLIPISNSHYLAVSQTLVLQQLIAKPWHPNRKKQERKLNIYLNLLTCTCYVQYAEKDPSEVYREGINESPSECKINFNATKGSNWWRTKERFRGGENVKRSRLYTENSRKWSPFVTQTICEIEKFNWWNKKIWPKKGPGGAHKKLKSKN